MSWREDRIMVFSRRALPWLAATLLAAGCSRELQKPTRRDTGVKVLMFGIDGATWKVLDPMMARGELPNLKRLCDEGVRARLQSLDSLSSPQVWTTLATGKTPRNHGVRKFRSTRGNLKAARIWDVVSDSGEKVGTFGWMVTWMPDRLNGFVVPDWMARGPETWPPELQFIGECRKKGGTVDVQRAAQYGLTEESKKVYEQYVRDVESAPKKEWEYLFENAMLSVHGDLFIHLYRSYDPLLAAYMTPAVDHASHVFWKFFETTEADHLNAAEVARYKEYIPAVYREVDRLLGRVMAAVSSNTAIVVMSDHGFGRSGTMQPLDISAEMLLKKLGWKDVEYERTGHRVILRFAGSSVDRKEAIARLRSFRFVELNQPALLVTEEADGDGVMLQCGVPAEWAEELGHVTIGKDTMRADWLFSDDPQWSGTHALMGVIILYGPPFRRGAEIEKAHVLDVAPTVMAALGYPLARDMEGHVLEDALQPDFLKKHRLRYVDTYGPPPPFPEDDDKKGLSDEDKERLKSLGYL